MEVTMDWVVEDENMLDKLPEIVMSHWSTNVNPATQKAEIRKIRVLCQSMQDMSEIPSQASREVWCFMLVIPATSEATGRRTALRPAQAYSQKSS
jgi:hypothetical protein